MPPQGEQNPAYRNAAFVFILLVSMMNIDQLKEFFSERIWQITKEELPRFQYLGINVLKRIILAIKFFIDKDVISTASALTYSTLLALVPVIAVLYAIANGFGFSTYIESWLMSALNSQPQAAEVIIGFVHSYISNTHSGVILGVGLLFMLWTVLMLIHNIEAAFNQIWQVEQQRSLIRKVTDYLAMFFLAPIIIVLQSGISIFLATIAKEMEEYMLLGPMVRTFIGLMPYVITSCVFIVLYMFMPNTRVRFKDAIIPGILAGIAMQLLQFFYIHCQVFLSGYNAIYGSFAALPLFMLWVQLSWTICLFGAELTYTSQNLEEFAFLANPNDLSQKSKMKYCALLMHHICNNFKNDQQHLTALQLKQETGIPIRIVKELLNLLVDIRLLSVSASEGDDVEQSYQPHSSLEYCNMGKLIETLENYSRGNKEHKIKVDEFDGKWEEVDKLHDDYLQKLRNIPLSEL